MTDLSSSALRSELYGVYQDGKMKRYSLLWAVNGGAFAILKFSLEQSTPAGQDSSDAPAATGLINDAVLSDQLPWGMIAFTLLVFVDIWKFGWMMRREGLDQHAFQCAGQFILIVISALIATGWTLITVGQGTFDWIGVSACFATLVGGLGDHALLGRSTPGARSAVRARLQRAQLSRVYRSVADDHRRRANRHPPPAAVS